VLASDGIEGTMTRLDVDDDVLATMPALMTIADLADLLDQDWDDIDRWARSKGFPLEIVTIGRRYVLREDVIAWLG
jgi:hypothetical protein